MVTTTCKWRQLKIVEISFDTCQKNSTENIKKLYSQITGNLFPIMTFIKKS